MLYTSSGGPPAAPGARAKYENKCWERSASSSTSRVSRLRFETTAGLRYSPTSSRGAARRLRVGVPFWGECGQTSAQESMAAEARGRVRIVLFKMIANPRALVAGGTRRSRRATSRRAFAVVNSVSRVVSCRRAGAVARVPPSGKPEPSLKVEPTRVEEGKPHMPALRPPDPDKQKRALATRRDGGRARDEVVIRVHDVEEYDACYASAHVSASRVGNLAAPPLIVASGGGLSSGRFPGRIVGLALQRSRARGEIERIIAHVGGDERFQSAASRASQWAQERMSTLREGATSSSWEVETMRERKRATATQRLGAVVRSLRPPKNY